MEADIMPTIRVRAFPPYRSWLGGQSELVLDAKEPVALDELWAMLAQAYPRFAELLALGTDEKLSRTIVVLQNGRLLGLHDVIDFCVPIELLPSMAGG
jgi:molybdopterin converting factor small subunit